MDQAEFNLDAIDDVDSGVQLIETNYINPVINYLKTKEALGYDHKRYIKSYS